ncbi:hypothetical protein RMS29_027410 (plasmid) [Agrobacterium rosae]|uniref:Uncharacterized protein n=1 Tax=Agrobacterium rosae TaxID=1972867 RepID=A0AAW9FI44_9HYPH|nr:MULTISPECIES: hypothetical protein [Agrobacterium]MCF1501591.1 hypothetical protein [Allorhizobium sp. Av2]MDX8321683.1 hypothetical protein [Agrobacterium sp. rho-8.1]MDX8305145.1 hypothetical protein [Agrobacterium rosae]MDX8311428.1 hypothetical protein [Agrobacterium sp. rho-13.3]MDX8316339.1 hypothetical protein [Agrobacterium rosae]
MTKIADKKSAVEALDAAAVLWKEVDDEFSAIWMKLPDEAKKRLNAEGGEKFDALTMSHRLKEIAEAARSQAST